MYHNLPCDASFWAFLFSIDQDLASSARQKTCPCGGRLHSAKYPRKPRGGDNLPEQYGYRLSFCCDQDGCRKRVTPPSVRFLGRKVYLGAVVILVAAMRQGPSPRRVRELSQLFGADRRTIARWQVFGENTFRRHGSGRSPAVAWCRRWRSKSFRCRSWTLSLAATIPAGTGAGCCCFLAHHDQRGLGDWGFPLISAHPQKTLLDGPGRPGYLGM